MKVFRSAWLVGGVEVAGAVGGAEVAGAAGGVEVAGAVGGVEVAGAVGGVEVYPPRARNEERHVGGGQARAVRRALVRGQNEDGSLARCQGKDRRDASRGLW